MWRCICGSSPQQGHPLTTTQTCDTAEHACCSLVYTMVELYQYHDHCGRAALTIATIPACTALGRLSHVRITRARSSEMCDTHMTHFSRKNMSFWCSDMLFWCGDT